MNETNPQSHGRGGRLLRHARRRRTQYILGVILAFLGLYFLAVSPDTPTSTVLLRLIIGFGLLLAGFITATIAIIHDVIGSAED